MYFPYLRGKQFELIALKEICSLLSANRAKVSPIIEPVKDSTTFKSTLLDFRKNDINFNVIINPSVGDLINTPVAILDILKGELGDYNNYQIAIIIDKRNKHNELLHLAKNHSLNPAGVTLIHNCIYDNVSDAPKKVGIFFPLVFNVINLEKTSSRYYREFDQSTRVRLEDPFKSKQKNSEYLDVEESSFSEEHIYFSQDGYIGFSDFLTIGDNYSEGGFLPYAVAIHLTYANSNKRIQVKHFVSDSNMDNSDIGGKFAEALTKLITWCDSQGLNTIGIEKFREFHRNGHFPGLGSIKKLSIMNHIELVLSLI